MQEYVDARESRTSTHESLANIALRRAAQTKGSLRISTNITLQTPTAARAQEDSPRISALHGATSSANTPNAAATAGESGSLPTAESPQAELPPLGRRRRWFEWVTAAERYTDAAGNPIPRRQTRRVLARKLANAASKNKEVLAELDGSQQTGAPITSTPDVMEPTHWEETDTQGAMRETCVTPDAVLCRSRKARQEDAHVQRLPSM